jgi:excisionase family DNA binding protein
LTVTEALPDAVARLHNIEQAQERLGVGRSKVFQLIGSGELRSVQVGRRRLVPEQAIRDFIARLDRQAGA